MGYSFNNYWCWRFSIFYNQILRLKKKNDNLKLEMKSLVFSNDIRNNVLIEENKISKNETDYESTFI